MRTACLFASDYGPADPTFDPMAGDGQLLLGFEAHHAQLAQAQNLGQLEAMKRKLQRGETIIWCDQGYSWVYARPVDYFFGFVAVAFILPYLAMRLLPGFRKAVVERGRLLGFSRGGAFSRFKPPGKLP